MLLLLWHYTSSGTGQPQKRPLGQRQLNQLTFRHYTADVGAFGLHEIGLGIIMKGSCKNNFAELALSFTPSSAAPQPWRTAGPSP